MNINKKIFDNVDSPDELKALSQEKIFFKKVIQKNDLTDTIIEKNNFLNKWTDYKEVAKIAVDTADLNENKIIFIKSFRNFPYIDDDLDIVVKGSTKKYGKSLEKLGFTKKQSWASFREPLKRHYVNSKYDTVIHIHKQGSWNGIIAIDIDDVFRNSIEKDLGDFSVIIPNNDIEFLIQAAQFIFEDYYITLGSLAYIQYLIKGGVNWRNVFSLAEKQNWKSGLYLFLKFLQENYEILEVPNLLPLKKNIVKEQKEHLYPNFINYKRLFPTYIRKMKRDLTSKTKNVVWQLMIYFFITPVWKYFLPKYRLKKFYNKNIASN